MASAEWCPRRSFYRIHEDYPDEPVESASYVLENIWDEGHYVHSKYQDRLWSMGLLRGLFKCKACEYHWHATSPTECAECGMPRGCLEYREVPLRSEKYHVIGHSDGDVVLGGPAEDDPLIEIKTIGEGTVRVDNPSLLMKHTHRVPTSSGERSVVDLAKVWDDIKRPFPAHIRQGMLYCYLLGRTRMAFIYECKWNQQTKEFVVRFRKKMIADLLDSALDVKYGLEKGRAPHRPGWADGPENETCAKCPYVGLCWNNETESKDEGQERPGDGPDRRQGQGDPGRSPRRAPAAEEADIPQPRRRRRGSTSDAPTAPKRVVRRRSDAAVRRPDTVD